MQSVTSVNLHHFTESVLAEVIEETPDGEISIRSHELEYVDSNEAELRPQSSIPSTDAMLINQFANSNGIRVQIGETTPPKPDQ